MEPVRIGVVGCGVIGRTHTDLARQFDHVKIEAVADLNKDAANAAAKDFNVPKAYGDAASLLADPEIDGVVVALPTGVRGPVAADVLRAGKHLLIEKPPGMNAGEVRQLLEPRGDRIVTCCSSRMRGTPSAAKALEVIRSGVLGPVRVLQCRCLKADGGPGENPPPVWRVSHKLNGGGFFVNWGIYDMDYLLGLMGFALKPQWVMAGAWPIAPGLPGRVAEGSDAECHALVTIACEGGVIVMMERAEFTSSATTNAWSIVGDKATLRLHMTPGTGKQHHLDTLDAEKGVLSEVIWEGDEDWKMCHAGPIRDFATAVQTGSIPATATTLEQALMMQVITDAVYASSRTGQPVQIKA